MKFPLINLYKGFSGDTYAFEYTHADSIEFLPKEKIKQVIAFAFYGDKMLLVNNINKPKAYFPPGGSLEKGESPQEALIREMIEETNMKIIDYKLIGYQKCENKSKPNTTEEYQIRYFAIVEPIGPFVSDPDGDVTELLMIDPKDYKKYFNWGNTGDALMERALLFLNTFNQSASKGSVV